MDYGALFQRIMKTVDTAAYFTPVEHVDPSQRPGLALVRAAMASEFDQGTVTNLIESLFTEGALDAVHRLSALHVLACHPSVADWPLAARLVGEQELSALDAGGPYLQANLASVERHRGVLAFLKQHYEVAIEYFTRALERQRTPENLTNVLCTLVRLGEEEEASALVAQVRSGFPADFVAAVELSISSDPDLVLLREV